jgi:hypothetical protein
LDQKGHLVDVTADFARSQSIPPEGQSLVQASFGWVASVAVSFFGDKMI